MDAAEAASEHYPYSAQLLIKKADISSRQPAL